MNFAVYTRSLDYGRTTQWVYLNSNIVVYMHYDTIDGSWFENDDSEEWVGKPKSVLRGKGFRKVRNAEKVDQCYMEWLQAQIEGE